MWMLVDKKTGAEKPRARSFFEARSTTFFRRRRGPEMVRKPRARLNVARGSERHDFAARFPAHLGRESRPSEPVCWSAARREKENRMATTKTRTKATRAVKKTTAAKKPAQKSEGTVAAYLAALPADKRKELSRVREVFRKSLPEGYAESVRWGMISYCVPLARYPDAPNGQPLCYAGLAARKNNLTLHFMTVYMPAIKKRLEAAFKAAKKKLDMGKACIRFRSAEDLPLDAIGELVAAVPVDEWIAITEAMWNRKR